MDWQEGMSETDPRAHIWQFLQCSVSLLPIFWADPPERARNCDVQRSSCFLEQNWKMVLQNVLLSIEQMHTLKKCALDVSEDVWA